MTEREALKKLADALIVLNDVQWSCTNGDGRSACPVCYADAPGYAPRSKNDGLHEHDCELAVLIDVRRREPPKKRTRHSKSS